MAKQFSKLSPCATFFNVPVFISIHCIGIAFLASSHFSVIIITTLSHVPCFPLTSPLVNFSSLCYSNTSLFLILFSFGLQDFCLEPIYSLLFLYLYLCVFFIKNFFWSSNQCYCLMWCSLFLHFWMKCQTTVISLRSWSACRIWLPCR